MPDDAPWTTTQLREYVDRALAHEREIQQQRAETSQKAVEVALAANETRLAAMNEFRASLDDQSRTMMTRKEGEIITEKLNDISRTNWPLLVSTIAVFLVIVGGMWAVIGLKIDNSQSGLSLAVGSIQATQVTGLQRLGRLEQTEAAGASSRGAAQVDRAQLNQRLLAVEQRIAVGQTERRTNEAGMGAKLAEIETQFCASDTVRNLLHANDLRFLAMLWHKLFPDTTLPTDNAYYPQICQRTVQITAH